MNTAKLALILLSTTLTSFAQGEVVFGNLGGGVDAPVFYGASDLGPGPAYNAQLYVLRDDSFTPLTPITQFRPLGPGPEAIATRYLESVTVVVPGVAPGESATFAIRVWHNSFASFEPARDAGWAYGESAPFTITVGGGLLPPANLTTLQSFSTIPEPSILALAIAGTGLLFLRRRY